MEICSRDAPQLKAAERRSPGALLAARVSLYPQSGWPHVASSKAVERNCRSNYQVSRLAGSRFKVHGDKACNGFVVICCFPGSNI